MDGIYRIDIPLAGSPLKKLNAFFIQSEGEQLLIDTGFRTDGCYQALQEALKERNADLKNLQIVLTHMHADHCGNINRVAQYDNIVYMGAPDVDFSLIRGLGSDIFNRDARFLEEGFLPEWIEYQHKENPAFTKWMDDPAVLNFRRMNTGDMIRVGKYELSWILVPGHTPGNSMLYEKNHKLMFTGDHILFDITPNITSWPTMPDALGSYLDSLNNSSQYDVQLALPGHREFTGEDYHERIETLILHHHKRLAQVLSIIKEHPGENAVQICSKMTWKIRCRNWDEFPLVQKLFAVGETFSHLDYLTCRNKIVREKGSDGYYHYTVA